MLELSNKRVLALLWILENKGKNWSIFELQKKSGSLAYGPLHTFVKELEKNGFIVKDGKTNEYHVSKASDLIRLLSLARPFSGLKTAYFHSSLGFSKSLSLIAKAKLDYAFTLFGGSELYRPYVKTDQVHVYVRDEDKEKWAKHLISKKCLKAEKGQANLFLIPTKEEFIFKLKKIVKGFTIAPMPLLLSDLLSFGGLAEEQGNFLLEEWLNNRI